MDELRKSNQFQCEPFMVPSENIKRFPQRKIKSDNPDDGVAVSIQPSKTSEGSDNMVQNRRMQWSAELAAVVVVVCPDDPRRERL